jgi:hypothetical protein
MACVTVLQRNLPWDHGIKVGHCFAGGVTRLLVLVAGQRVMVCTSPKLDVATGHVGSKAEATTHE